MMSMSTLPAAEFCAAPVSGGGPSLLVSVVVCWRLAVSDAESYCSSIKS